MGRPGNAGIPSGPDELPDRPTYPGGPVYPSPGTAQTPPASNPTSPSGPAPEPKPPDTPQVSPEDQAAWDRWQERLYKAKHPDPPEPSQQKAPVPVPKPGSSPGGPAGSEYPWWADPTKNPDPKLDLPKFEAPNAGLDMGLQNEIDGYLRDVLSGQSKRYSPEQLQKMKDQSFMTNEAGRKKAVEGANRDALSRGLFRSGIPIDAQMQAEQEAAAATSKDQTNIDLTAASAEFEDKMQALDRAQKSLDSRRSYLLQLDKNSMERTIGEAQMRLEQAKINAAKSQLDRDMSAKYDINKSNEALQRDLAAQQSATAIELAKRNEELQKWLLLNTPRSGGSSAPKYTPLDLPGLGPAPVF